MPLDLVGHNFNLPVTITAQNMVDMRKIYETYAYFEGVLLALADEIENIYNRKFDAIVTLYNDTPEYVENNIGKIDLQSQSYAIDTTLTTLYDEIGKATDMLGKNYVQTIIELDPRLEKVYDRIQPRKDDVWSLQEKLDEMGSEAKKIGDEIMLIIKDDKNRRPHLN